jgi:hypothetical protein
VVAQSEGERDAQDARLIVGPSALIDEERESVVGKLATVKTTQLARSEKSSARNEAHQQKAENSSEKRLAS